MHLKKKKKKKAMCGRFAVHTLAKKGGKLLALGKQILIVLFIRVPLLNGSYSYIKK